MCALELEALIYKLLRSHTKLAVYNHVPDDAVAPFIRIGDISLLPWLRMPPSACADLTLAIFSEEQSNSEVIKIASRVREVLAEYLIRQSYPNIIQTNLRATRIFQLKNLSWCAEIELEVRHYIKNEEPKCTTQK